MYITEMRNPRSKNLDLISTGDAVEIFIGGEIRGLKRILKEKKSIEDAIASAVKALIKGGRVFYIGAGTSGRIGVIDAAEVHPTFGTPKNKFQAVIAGGKKAVFSSVERAEDDIKSAADAVRTGKIGPKDMGIGITASGRTPFVLSALKEAKRQRAETWLVTFNEIQKPPFVDGLIKVITGPEILTGSTRLKAGTATKVILNMISTLTMVRLGKVYQNLMVDVKPTNKKLRERAKNIIKETTGASEREAEKFLKASKGNAKLAILMKLKKLNYNEAMKLLKNHEGMLRTALK